MKNFFSVLMLIFSFSTYAAPVTIELDQVKISELARVVYGDLLKKSFTFDDVFVNSPVLVSASWLNQDAQKIDQLFRELLIKSGFELVDQAGVYRISPHDKVDDDLLIFQPRFRSAKYLSDILLKVFDVQNLGARGLSVGGGQAAVDFAGASVKPATAGAASAVVDRGALDQLAYNCKPARCDRLRSLLVQLDQPEAQVILKAAVYEVGTTRGDGSALQIVGSLLKGKLNFTAGAVLAGSNQLHLVAGGLDAVLSILDQDSRFHSVSRPMLRVKTGGQAKFSVGQQVPTIGASNLTSNGTVQNSIEYRSSGTILTVSPDVRLDVVDLSITQELSSFVPTTTGVNNSPTLLQRTVNSQLSVKNGELVVFAGLEENRDDDTNKSFFGWNVSNVKNKTSSEVLVFIEATTI